jgi:hypothetical protein
MAHDVASSAPDSRRLGVLFIGGFDSTNYAYVELVRELAARGHVCTVIVENERDVVNNKMFVSAGIAMVPLSEFSLRDLDSVDFVFSSPFLRRQHRALYDAIYERHKFIVAFANLFSAVTMRIAPDLVITTSESKFEDFADNGLRYNMVAVGNPQYDPLIRARDSRPAGEERTIRKVLVVDQGAYPFGDTGKAQLADTLVDIARNNPEMTFHIKPRYLPEEDGEHLHSMSEHLYSHLHDTPDNLVLIQKPTILEDLILDFDAMITTWSTAHLDAVVLDLPLLLIGGLDSVDVFDVRRQRIAAAYDHLRDTGCLVDWRDLRRGPCPFGRVSEEYVRREFYDVTTPCAPRIVDLLEKVDTVLLRNDRAFAGSFQLPYEGFMHTVETLETCDAGSEEQRLNRRLFRELNTFAQSLVFDHRYMGFALDMSEMLPFWDLRVGPGAGEQDIAPLVQRARDVGTRLKASYFATHPDEVAGDRFVQDSYFDHLLATGRYADLSAYRGPVVVPESLEFDKGMACLKRLRPLRAARHFVESFSLSLMKPCRELKKDKNIKVLLSRTDTQLLAHVILFSLNHYRKYEALGFVDIPSRPNFEALVYYKTKALVALGRLEEAKALYGTYVTATERKTPMTHGTGFKNRVLLFVIGRYRALLRRYVARLH